MSFHLLFIEQCDCFSCDGSYLPVRHTVIKSMFNEAQTTEPEYINKPCLYTNLNYLGDWEVPASGVWSHLETLVSVEADGISQHILTSGCTLLMWFFFRTNYIRNTQTLWCHALCCSHFLHRTWLVPLLPMKLIHWTVLKNRQMEAKANKSWKWTRRRESEVNMTWLLLQELAVRKSTSHSSTGCL